MIALIQGSPELLAGLRAAGEEVVECAFGSSFDTMVAARHSELDAVVVGPEVADSLQAAASAHRVDHQVGVVIVCTDGAQYDRIRAAIQLAPSIENYVECTSAPQALLVSTITAAAARTRARRRRTLAVVEKASLDVAPHLESRPLRERYAAHLIDLAPVGIIATDEDRRILSVNLEGARVLGTAERALAGLSLVGAALGVHGGTWERLLCAEDHAVDPLRFARSIAGETHWLEARAVAISDDSGRGYLVVFADVTERVVAEAARSGALENEKRGDQEQARPFQLLVASVKDYAIFILDPEGNVATWNPGAERIKGYTASEIIGKHFSAFYPPDVAATGKCEAELEIATREGRFEEEGWRIRKDGSRLWANVTITALHDPDSGALVGFAKVTRDLTERVRSETILQQLAAERAALAEKARVQEFQERFIAILGHDLRNPLSAVDMGAGLVRQRAASVNDEALVRVGDRMLASTRRMSRMIEQILELARSRLGGGLEVKPARMDLRTAIVAVVDELRAAYPTRVINVDCPRAVVGEWDRDRLEQVFSNLIGNAVHYGDHEQPVTIEVREEGAAVVVAVHNHGRPIPEALRGELFNPFRRGERDSKTAETAGLGLGLYISRELAVAHRGDIEVRSTSAEGTTFRVLLPRLSSSASVQRT